MHICFAEKAGKLDNVSEADNTCPRVLHSRGGGSISVDLVSFANKRTRDQHVILMQLRNPISHIPRAIWRIQINVKLSLVCCSEKAKWRCFADEQFGLGRENAALGKKKQILGPR